VSSGAGVTIAPGGFSEIYFGSISISIRGNGVLNDNGCAGNFIIYCADSVTDFTLNGNGEFTGVLVAPNADIKMNGGGNSDQDFTGAVMVNSFRMNGHFKFHYHEALGRMGSNGRFLITSWAEVN
jgi:choice-of-anchor A domain-containing protein